MQMVMIKVIGLVMSTASVACKVVGVGDATRYTDKVVLVMLDILMKLLSWVMFAAGDAGKSPEVGDARCERC